MRIHFGGSVAIDEAVLLNAALGLERCVGLFVLDSDNFLVLVVFIFDGHARGGRVRGGSPMVGLGFDAVGANDTGVCCAEPHALADLSRELGGRLF